MAGDLISPQFRPARAVARGTVGRGGRVGAVSRLDAARERHEAGEGLVAETTADLRPVLHEIANEIADAIARELPELGLGDDPGTLAEARASALATFSYFTSIIEDQADPRDIRLPPETARLVRDFAHLGADGDGLQRTVRIGQGVFWAWWLAALRRRCKDLVQLANAIELGSHQQLLYCDAFASAVSVAHAQERAQWVRSAAAVRADTVRAILGDAAIDVDAASARLGYDLRREHTGLLVWSDADDGEIASAGMARAATALAAAVGAARPLLVPLNALVLAAWVGGTAARQVDELSSTAVSETTRGRFHWSVGMPGRGVEGFRRTHLQATSARRVAMLAARGPGTITRYSRVALASLASANLEEAKSLVERELGPLASDDDEMRRLAATLRVYLEEGSSLEGAARRLGIHKNTVNNRIRRARELIGNGFDERRLEIQVALVLKRVVSSAGDAVAGSRPRSDPAF